MPEGFERYRTLIESRLKELLVIPDANKTLADSMNYSVGAGGKRLRPILNIMANQMMGGDMDETLDIACAIEMIHTYSLVHDDLPAMDDDELRRGKPTNHIVFGEAFAILTGDGLLNYAFEVMLQNAMKYPQNMEAHVRAINEVAVGAGAKGMVTGQCADIENEGQMLTEQELIYTHTHKTGELFQSSLVSGLQLCGPDGEQMEAMRTFGYKLGLTFQIIDDILDDIGDSRKTGKSVGRDKKSRKFTFATLYGVEGSKKIAKESTQEAKQALDVFGEAARPLLDFADSILERDR